MDYTAWWFLLIISLVGYLVVGLLTGALVSELIYRDGGDEDDAKLGGGISATAWPIAILVLIGAGAWHWVINPLLTPRAVRAKQKEEREKRKAEGKPAVGAYVD